MTGEEHGNGADESVDDDGSDDDGSDGDDANSTRTGEFGLADDVVAPTTGDAPTSDDADPTVADANADQPGEDPTQPGGSDADAPLSSVASSVAERRERAADQSDDDLFSEESVPEIDTDVVWDRLDEEGPSELPGDVEQEFRVIEKRSYCEQCPYFSEPPDVQCTHDGTEILELVDMDSFRVVNCPKVREDERLEQL